MLDVQRCPSSRLLNGKSLEAVRKSPRLTENRKTRFDLASRPKTNSVCQESFIRPMTNQNPLESFAVIQKVPIQLRVLSM